MPPARRRIPSQVPHSPARALRGDLGELEAALAPLAWTELATSVRIGHGHRIESVEIRALVRATVLEGTDAEVRRGLYLQAEEVICTVERRGWRHSRVPRVELGGSFDFVASRWDGPRIIHACEVRLEGCLT